MIFKKLVLVTIFVLLHSAAWAIPPIPEIPAFPSIQSNGNTYHVDKDTGNNTTGNGSSSSPWATIQYGINRLSAGDTLIVHEGATAYSEQITVDTFGTSTSWITIRGADGERPVLGNSTYAYGFTIESPARYIYIKNFKIIDAKKHCVRFHPRVQHFVLDNVEIDGSNASHGLMFGADIDDNNGPKHGYIRDVEVHHTRGYGVLIENGTEDITFERVISRNSRIDDGFSGRAQLSEPNSPVNDLYFIDCQAYENAGDGFDIGTQYGSTVFKNCISRDNGGSQGVGFKTWGADTWFINCLAHDNDYPGINIKNFWTANVYILNCTLVNNYNGCSQIVTAMSGGGAQMADVDLYLYNNIFMMDGEEVEYKRRAVEFFHTNAKIKESNNNYFFSPTNANAFLFRDNLSTYKKYFLSDIGAGKAWNTDTGNGSNSFSRNTASDGLADPGFINLANDDYALKNSSLAVDAATDVSVTDDIIGTQRPQGGKVDIGVFEYQVMEVAIVAPKNLRIVK